jgi:hypothetical protein
MKNVTTLFLGASLLTLAACGNNDSSSSTKKQQPNLLITEEGHYQATLAPINAHLAGDVTGTALVKVVGDSMTFEVKVNGSPAQVVHAQNVHIASECPTLSSDVNKDGVIDAVEAQKSYGPIIIPLDSDLKTQVEKEVKFPTADFTGNYFYRQNVSMNEMLKDLTQKDNNISDNIVKLNSNLGLAGRQIVIYGVAADAALPESVATVNGQAKHSSLPIACGSFIKIAVNEGTNTNGGKEE